MDDAAHGAGHHSHRLLAPGRSPHRVAPAVFQTPARPFRCPHEQGRRSQASPRRRRACGDSLHGACPPAVRRLHRVRTDDWRRLLRTTAVRGYRARALRSGSDAARRRSGKRAALGSRSPRFFETSFCRIPVSRISESPRRAGSQPECLEAGCRGRRISRRRRHRYPIRPARCRVQKDLRPYRRVGPSGACAEDRVRRGELRCAVHQAGFACVVASSSRTRGMTSRPYSSMQRIIRSCRSGPALYFRSKRDSPRMDAVAAIFFATVSGAPT